MTNKTTINAVAEAIREASAEYDSPCDYGDAEGLTKAAIEAYEKVSVKEMSVEELAAIIDIELCDSWYSSADQRPHAKARRTRAVRIAKALEKLGIIRRVESGE